MDRPTLDDLISYHADNGDPSHPAPAVAAATLAALRRLKSVEVAATKAAEQFEFYAREHTAQGKIEKAATNQRFADMLRATLTETPNDQ